MNASIVESRPAEPAKSTDDGTSIPTEPRRIDVTGLPADRVAEYVEASGDNVHFERRAGKTYVVAADQ